MSLVDNFFIIQNFRQAILRAAEQMRCCLIQMEFTPSAVSATSFGLENGRRTIVSCKKRLDRMKSRGKLPLLRRMCPLPISSCEICLSSLLREYGSSRV